MLGPKQNTDLPNNKSKDEPGLQHSKPKLCKKLTNPKKWVVEAANLSTIFLKGWSPDNVTLPNCVGWGRVLPLLQCWTADGSYELRRKNVIKFLLRSSHFCPTMWAHKGRFNTPPPPPSSPQEARTSFCWPWHVETNWLPCRAGPMETPFRCHISTWPLWLFIVCSRIHLETPATLSNSTPPAWWTSELRWGLNKPKSKITVWARCSSRSALHRFALF